MSKSLCNKVGEIGQDNLIAKLFPPAETYGITVTGGEGELARGTVMALVDGSYVVLDEDSTGKANCVLADPVDASGEDGVTAVAYRTGHLNRKALIVANGYTMTATDEEELRKCGILLSDMAE